MHKLEVKTLSLCSKLLDRDSYPVRLGISSITLLPERRKLVKQELGRLLTSRIQFYKPFYCACTVKQEKFTKE